jgi:hypothetical protein
VTGSRSGNTLVATTAITSEKTRTMNFTFLGCQSRLFCQADNLIGATPLNQIDVEQARSYGI